MMSVGPILLFTILYTEMHIGTFRRLQITAFVNNESNPVHLNCIMQQWHRRCLHTINESWIWMLNGGMGSEGSLEMHKCMQLLVHNQIFRQCIWIFVLLGYSKSVKGLHLRKMYWFRCCWFSKYKLWDCARRFINPNSNRSHCSHITDLCLRLCIIFWICLGWLLNSVQYFSEQINVSLLQFWSRVYRSYMYGRFEVMDAIRL